MTYDGTGPPTTPRSKGGRSTRTFKLEVSQSVYDGLDELSDGEPGRLLAHLAQRFIEFDGKCRSCGQTLMENH